MHRDFDQKFSDMTSRLQTLEQQVKDLENPGYRDVNVFSGEGSGRSSIVDEVFNGRK
jgi:hypothetical protein